jgi:hypothetical protein
MEVRPLIFVSLLGLVLALIIGIVIVFPCPGSHIDIDDLMLALECFYGEPERIRGTIDTICESLGRVTLGKALPVDV